MKRSIALAGRAALVGGFLAASVAGALAADLVQRRRAPAPEIATVPAGWIISVGAVASVGPRFPGSDRFGFFGYPQVSWRKVGEPRRFYAADDGLELELYGTPAFRFGIAGRYRGGRYLEDDRRLIGFRKIEWAAEPGLFLEFWPAEFLRARAEVRRGFNGHEGFVADLGLDVVNRFGAFTWSVGPRVALGDAEFTRTYFGVQPFEAAINRQVTPYRPDGGVTSVGANTTLTYDWSQQWTTMVFATYERLVGDAGRSPIVRRFGSEDQITVGAGVTYSFVTSGW